MEDLGLIIDELQTTELPKLPLNGDCKVGPIILLVMLEVGNLERCND